MKAPAALEPSEAERLLLTTGLLDVPGRDQVVASRAIWRELVGLLEEAIGCDDPGRLYAMTVGDTYADRLVRADPDYAAFNEQTEAGAQFQLLQTEARQRLIDSRPVTTIMTVAGEREIAVEPEGIEQKLWLLEADTIEFPRRLVHDIAAGALCYEQVLAFAGAFPETYSGLVQVAQAIVSKKGPKWYPPLWLNDMLHVLYQEQLGTGVKTQQAQRKPLTPQRKTKGAIDLESFKSPADAAL